MGDTGSLWYLKREHYSYMIFGGSLVLVPLVKKKQFFYESLMEPRLASTVDKDNLELGILHLHLPGDRITPMSVTPGLRYWSSTQEP